MKRIMWLVAPALLGAAAPVALAGYYAKCTLSTQECLDMMAAKLHNKGWIGLEIDDASGKMAITKVLAGSPAEAAGLQAGDVLFAVSGVEYSEANTEKLTKIRETMTPGKAFTFTIVKGGEEKTDVALTLAKLPDEVLTQWLGKHMLEHATLAQASEPKP